MVMQYIGLEAISKLKSREMELKQKTVALISLEDIRVYGTESWR